MYADNVTSPNPPKSGQIDPAKLIQSMQETRIFNGDSQDEKTILYLFEMYTVPSFRRVPVYKCYYLHVRLPADCIARILLSDKN